MSKYKVFLSRANVVGGYYEESVERLIQFLNDRDIETVTIGADHFSNDAPIDAIKKQMNDCSGVIVLGTPQELIKEGIRKPNANGQKDIKNEIHSTVWNQIEGAMGFCLDLPIMLITDNGINEGIFEKGVLPILKQEYNLKNSEWIDSNKFKGALNSFIEQL
ncbi:hypothetical protein [Apilactobacillus timberlakei]|uniref:CD-NTase-associated protein 12/Pycsar effector protein TIR domain-containing protein n=1 Tax=Apilactobacillus timberlakei TaxID=2008380 RepID=A0ABY2YRA0_9LACO|nr:hypothetical protein [Apilactobacillus timberlakei]TPR12292.1 hypothetical protein DY048_07800 [Apilactobacillus timberlakei]TPR12820.1 hypothetical protein DY052_09065 [Apilactobacillus timberlakei]